MLQTILISVARVAVVTGISIAWCKWYMDKKKKQQIGGQNMTEKKVYTRRIAYELRLKGFKIIRLEPNPNRPEFNIYVFQSTPELESAFKEIVERQEVKQI